MLSVVNTNCSVRFIKPPGEDFEAVAEIEPPSTSYTMLADALALPTPFVPDITPSDLAPVPTPLHLAVPLSMSLLGPLFFSTVLF